jgi:hypothetical protein
MSIKNIIQQENDLQEMSQQSLANYLNNPTGQYNPYLVAGELQRKEQFAQRQMVEAPQETVVDELVQKTMPMGGMPMPRPQEAMVSDTITETGIANLPAPNIGQNYAEGGIIGYEEGGEVEDYTAMEMLTEMAQEPDLVAEVGGSALLKAAGVASPYIKGAGLGALFYSPELGSAEDPNFLAKMQGQQNFDKGGLVDKIPLPGFLKFLKPLKKPIVDTYNKFKKKKATTPPATPKKKLTKKEQDAFLKKQKTPPQTALEKANQFKDTRSPTQKIKDKAKELYRSTSPDKGPLTRAGIATLRGAGQGVGPLTRGAKTAATRYPVESLLGLGGLGYGLSEYFGETEEEEAARLAADAAKKAAASQAELDRMEKTRLQNQAELDAEQAKRDAAAKRRAYLALALGGAKTMAGESPFALTNIGAGLGTGVASLVELDEADAARQSAELLADAKMRQNLYEFNQERRLKLAEFRAELSQDMDFRAAVDAQLEALGQDRTTIDLKTLAEIEEKVVMQFYPELGPTPGATMVNGETYAEV